jgi:ABC-type lipoprotein release transport system permease subunit
MLLIARLGWRNLWRHRRRTLITAVAMAVGVALCMASTAFQDGMFAKLFEVMVEQRLGHVQVTHPEYPAKRQLHDTLPDAAALVAKVDAVAGTRVVAPRLYGFALVGTEAKSEAGLLVGVDPKRELAIGPLADRIVRGRFVAPDAPDEATIGKDLAKDLGVDVGGSIIVVTQSADGSLGNALFTVVGVHRTGDMQLDRSGVYVNLPALQELLVLPDQVHGLTAVGVDPDAVPAYTGRVRAAISAAEVDVKSWSEASPQTAQLLGTADASAYILLVIVLGAAAFGVLNTMMMSVYERTRELGVLVAVGLRPGRMIAMILFESLSLAALAAAIGGLFGGLLDAWLVVKGVDLSAGGGLDDDGMSFAGVVLDPHVFGLVKPEGVITVMVAVFVVTFLASLWPAIRAARMRPVEAMRAE